MPPICWKAACGPKSALSAEAAVVSEDQADGLQLAKAKLPRNQLAK
jgi:hypothetical protein